MKNVKKKIAKPVKKKIAKPVKKSNSVVNVSVSEIAFCDLKTYLMVNGGKHPRIKKDESVQELADLGTAIHKEAQEVFDSMKRLCSKEELFKLLRSTIYGESLYLLDYLSSNIKDGESVEVHAEKKVSLALENGVTIKGSIDLYIKSEHNVFIIDLKTGYNDYEAYATPQIFMYAYVVASMLGDSLHNKYNYHGLLYFSSLHKTVGGYIPMSDMLKSIHSILTGLHSSTTNLNPKLKRMLPVPEGSVSKLNCNYCKYLTVCPTVEKEVRALDSVATPSVLDNSEISKDLLDFILTKSSTFTNLFKQVKEYAIENIKNNTGLVDGWEIENKVSRSEWITKDEEQISIMFEKIGIPEDKWYKKKIFSSVADIKKFLGEHMFNLKLRDYTTKVTYPSLKKVGSKQELIDTL